MKFKEAIQSANLHSATTHARAKADAVEGKAEQPRPTLTFDGFGINGPDEYRSRIAFFTSSEKGEQWGPLLAAAPELLAALEKMIARWDALDVENLGPGCRAIATQARASIAKAKGSL